MSINTVAIIGGGIGGLASAILLTRKGFQVTLYDKAKSPQPLGAGFLLQPPGQDILDELGVLEEVLKQAVPIFGLQSKTTTGRKILNLKYDRLKGSPRNGLGVQRSTIYDALLSEALKSNLLNFVWDSEIEKCTTIGEKVSIVANQGLQNYDLCILSSGANSDLADEHFKGRVKRPYGWGCLWTTIALPQTLSPNILHQRCKKSNKMMGILPVRKREHKYEAALYWSIKSKDIEKLSQDRFFAFKDDIMQFWPCISSSLEHLSFSDFVSAKYNDIWTPKPYTKRLIAIGDISHATSPQLGQGCTMALLDAWSVAKCIDKNDSDLAGSLESWWKSRRYQLAYVRRLSRFLTPLFQSESMLCEVFRDRIMAPVGRLPWFEDIQLKTLASEVLLTKFR